MKKIKVLELTTSFPRYIEDNAGIFIYKKAKTLNQSRIENHIISPIDLHAKKMKLWKG